MPIRDSLKHILDHYLGASQQDFAKHPLASFIRDDARDAIATAAGEHERLVFKGSAGQGTWVRGPWIAIFDSLVTLSAQSGYYPVYLFREDMQGLYLSLNQGMTVVKRAYKADAKTALRARAANFRAMLGSQLVSFPQLEIHLAPSAATNDTAFYEAGNICAKYYPADALPNEAQLVADLSQVVKLYEALVQGEADSESASVTDGDEPANMHYEDATKFRFHKRIERNASLSKAVKSHHGYTCHVCGVNFGSVYGEIGRDYIEAHHLKPLATLKGQRIAMNPVTDFAVLCSNCHRMVHRSGMVDDIEKFKQEHYRG